jgi:hypothetical protein
LLLRRIKIAAPVSLSDYVADAPFEHRLAVVSQPASSHGSIDLDDRQDESFCILA